MRKGYFTPPVLIILAIIIFAVAILIAINADFVKRIKKESSPAPITSPSPTTQQPTPTPDDANNKQRIKTLAQFKDSSGQTKYIVSGDLGYVDSAYVNIIYLSENETDISAAIKVKDIKGWDIRQKPIISNNQGKKYLLIWLGAADAQEFILSDENGNLTEIDFSKMGLGTTIPGMYGLKQGNWVGNTIQFTIIAVSGNGHSYEATFNAGSGKQLGETKQIV